MKDHSKTMKRIDRCLRRIEAINACRHGCHSVAERRLLYRKLFVRLRELNEFAVSDEALTRKPWPQINFAATDSHGNRIDIADCVFAEIRHVTTKMLLLECESTTLEEQHSLLQAILAS
jgi:hypothetical protein